MVFVNKRKNFLVDKKLQFSYAMMLVFQASIITLFLGGCLYWLNKEYLNLFHLIAGEESFPLKAVESIANEFLSKIFIILGLNCILLLILGIYSSHRLAGPIFRLTQYINSFAQGTRINPLRFRSSDHLQDIADAFNQMLDNLDRKASREKEIISELKEKVEFLINNVKINPNDSKFISDTTSQINKLLSELQPKA